MNLFSENDQIMVITTKSILYGYKPVLYVSHDDDDGIWQFLDGEDVCEENAYIVSLSEILKIDDSLNSLYDLPRGYIAYRQAKGDKWKRENLDSD